MSGIPWTGGTEQDRNDIMAVYEQYRVANQTGDWEKLSNVFSPSPEARFWNLNGYTYNGRDHWIRMWQYLRQHLNAGPGHSFDVHGRISGDIAAVYLLRRSSLTSLTNHRDATNWPILGKEYTSRATMIFSREPEGWRIIHAHFSNGNDNDSERPGGI
jgi:ketosteroid isomerase-like protein